MNRLKKRIELRYLLLTTLITLGLSFLINNSTLAQDQSYWYASFYKLDSFEKADSLRKMVAKYQPAILEEARRAGTILDEKVLFHHTGNEYNVVFLVHSPSWEALENLTGIDEAWENLDIDQEERERVQQAFSWIYEGSEHYDNIYTEAYERDQ